MKRKVLLPATSNENWRDCLLSQLKDLKETFIEIDCGHWQLRCRDISYINNSCQRLGVELVSIESYIPETIVSANSLGIKSTLNLSVKNNPIKGSSSELLISNNSKENLLFHKGTLRSGESLDTDGNLLILGDVNPGAIVSAGGDVMIWGRLLGIAHAGKNGNDQARITSLQLRPVQLRISNKIARGPKEKPEQGLAEEAIIQKGVIVIQPARNA